MVSGAPDEVEVLSAVVKAMTEVDNPNPHAQQAKALQPTVATANPALQSTNLLHDIDKATQVGVTCQPAPAQC